MLSFPHTPHALVARNDRDGTATGTVTVTRATLSSHIVIEEIPVPAPSSPSVYRNPAASSMSSPGVRIVTTTGEPSTLISRGSSTASTSPRGSRPPSAVTRSTWCLDVRSPTCSDYVSPGYYFL